MAVLSQKARLSLDSPLYFYDYFDLIANISIGGLVRDILYRKLY